MSRNKELSLKWFAAAENDLQYAKGNLKMGFYSPTCFLCQQSVEKALKALLFARKQKLVKTHNLERLLEKASFFSKDLLKIRKHCQILNAYYTDTRYPDIWDYDRFNDENLAKEALQLVKQALEFIKKKLE